LVGFFPHKILDLRFIYVDTVDRRNTSRANQFIDSRKSGYLEGFLHSEHVSQKSEQATVSNHHGALSISKKNTSKSH